MPIPLPHVLIGGVVVTAVVLTYELVFKKKTPEQIAKAKAEAEARAAKKAAAAGAPPPGATATAFTALPPAPADGGDQAPAPAVLAPQGPQGYQGGPQGYQGQGKRRRPAPPILSKLLAGRLGAPGAPRRGLVPGVPAIVGGRPVMSGDPRTDLIHMIGFHGYRHEDIPIAKRAQTMLGMAGSAVDGIVGQHTWAALATYAASHRMPMPPIGPFTQWSDGGASLAASIAAPGAPDRNV